MESKPKSSIFGNFRRTLVAFFLITLIISMSDISNAAKPEPNGNTIAPKIYQQHDLGSPPKPDLIYTIGVDCQNSDIIVSVLDGKYLPVEGAETYIRYMDFGFPLLTRETSDDKGEAVHKLAGNFKYMPSRFVLTIEKKGFRNKEIEFDVSTCFLEQKKDSDSKENQASKDAVGDASDIKGKKNGSDGKIDGNSNGSNDEDIKSGSTTNSSTINSDGSNLKLVPNPFESLGAVLNKLTKWNLNYTPYAQGNMTSLPQYLKIWNLYDSSYNISDNKSVGSTKIQNGSQKQSNEAAKALPGTCAIAFILTAIAAYELIRYDKE